MGKQLDIKQSGLILLFANHCSILEASFSNPKADNLSNRYVYSSCRKGSSLSLLARHQLQAPCGQALLSVYSPAPLIVSGIRLVGTKKVQQFLNGNVVSACCFQDTLTYRNQVTSAISLASFPRYLGKIGGDLLIFFSLESLGSQVKFTAIIQIKVYLFAHSINIQRIPYVTGTYLGIRITAMNQTDKSPVLIELIIQWVRWTVIKVKNIS